MNKKSWSLEFRNREVPLYLQLVNNITVIITTIDVVGLLLWLPLLKAIEVIKTSTDKMSQEMCNHTL